MSHTGESPHPRLRPAGIAEIDGRRIDVVSDGEMIEPSVTVRVIQVEGNRVVVERVPDRTE